VVEIIGRSGHGDRAENVQAALHDVENRSGVTFGARDVLELFVVGGGTVGEDESASGRGGEERKKEGESRGTHGASGLDGCDA
jgi:hypothetical protein